MSDDQNQTPKPVLPASATGVGQVKEPTASISTDAETEAAMAVLNNSDTLKPSEPVAKTADGAVARNSDSAKPASTNDSFNVPVKKSPLLVYALLQIPLVIFMVILLYVMYQSRQN